MGITKSVIFAKHESIRRLKLFLFKKANLTVLRKSEAYAEEMFYH